MTSAKFSGPGSQELEKVSIFTAKSPPIRENWFGGAVGKGINNKVTKDRIFHIFIQKSPLVRWSPNLVWGQTSRT